MLQGALSPLGSPYLFHGPPSPVDSLATSADDFSSACSSEGCFLDLAALMTFEINLCEERYDEASSFTTLKEVC
jgi:hypothetical protein